MGILANLGLAPSKHDKEIKRLVDNSWTSIRVGRRGSIHIDPAEVLASAEFEAARNAAKNLFDGG